MNFKAGIFLFCVLLGTSALAQNTIKGKIFTPEFHAGHNHFQEANQGEEVAIAIQGATVGRGIDEEDILLVDVPASHARRLRKLELTSSEQEILDELTALHRSENHFWGR